MPPHTAGAARGHAELVARCWAVHRRLLRQQRCYPKGHQRCYGSLWLDIPERRVGLAERHAPQPPLLLVKLLASLLVAQSSIVPLETLAMHVFASATPHGINQIKRLVFALRTYLAQTLGLKHMIVSVAGRGYRLADALLPVEQRCQAEDQRVASDRSVALAAGHRCDRS